MSQKNKAASVGQKPEPHGAARRQRRTRQERPQPQYPCGTPAQDVRKMEDAWAAFKQHQSRKDKECDKSSDLQVQLARANEQLKERNTQLMKCRAQLVAEATDAVERTKAHKGQLESLVAIMQKLIKPVES